MIDVVFSTDRLHLRTWAYEDVDTYLAYLNTPEVMRWLGEPISRDDYFAMVDRLNGFQAERGFCFWALERKSDAAFLGFCGLKYVNAEGTDLTGEFEIGWRLREDCWGKGYAKEAARASLDRAFTVHGAPRVVAFTVQGNTASWGLMERLGMERRADLDYHDPAYDGDLNPTIVYSITRDQWTARA